MFYAGIGSRKTPAEVLRLFTAVAFVLGRDRGWTLRSGAAPGADTAFETGALMASVGHDSPDPEIYLPWPGFEGRSASQVRLESPTREATKLASTYHPAWTRLSQGARRLHARNSHQVLGAMLDSPVERIVCWTPNGSGTGGTGQALRLADVHDIPVWDAGIPSVRARLEAFVAAGSSQPFAAEKPAAPEWLSEALNSGNGTYTP